MKKFFNVLFTLILFGVWAYWFYALATEGIIIFVFLGFFVAPITWFLGGIVGITGGKKK